MHIYLVIGPSGTGKTTIGKLLAERLNIPFYDADDFHPDSNIRKMNKGIPLCDEDRIPWLQKLARKIKLWQNDKGAVLACSALKEAYRKELMTVPETALTWIYLNADEAVVQQRLSERKAHFFNPGLLRSQYQDLEVPEYGCHVSVNKPPEEIVDEILRCVSKN